MKLNRVPFYLLNPVPRAQWFSGTWSFLEREATRSKQNSQLKELFEGLLLRGERAAPAAQFLTLLPRPW